MSVTERQLPEGFEVLEPFVMTWAISGTAERAQRRNDSSPQERIAFYEAFKDLAEGALERLDEKPLERLDVQEQRLRDLLLSFAQVALAVEIQGDAEPEHAKLRRELRITHAPAD
ncbi:hypothetical protein LJR225_003426 [Phenylobacterium sp. LjRoot225]|uniref:hypothetical protein n=1 Tax=Phenylobacterium sp. LjRoot225 TaxID=3342285 RepID=UPI003ECFA2FD